MDPRANAGALRRRQTGANCTDAPPIARWCRVTVHSAPKEMPFYELTVSGWSKLYTPAAALTNNRRTIRRPVIDQRDRGNLSLHAQVLP
ncbi:MAG TPA: hypothetical protein VMB03_03355 [Bryobacteraceae bacterium]|nr:hypothetical protein [Bryobacteraceae bacterium]